MLPFSEVEPGRVGVPISEIEADEVADYTNRLLYHEPPNYDRERTIRVPLDIAG